MKCLGGTFTSICHFFRTSICRPPSSSQSHHLSNTSILTITPLIKHQHPHYCLLKIFHINHCNLQVTIGQSTRYISTRALAELKSTLQIDPRKRQKLLIIWTRNINLEFQNTRGRKETFIWYVCKIFQTNNISNPQKLTCTYQGVRNVTFLEKFPYVLNK